MTMDPYYSVQIGPKLDPFCFQAIPGNSSAGPLCYQRQTGSQLYEMGEFNVLRFDVNLATGVGNVTSAVLAKGDSLWIVNNIYGVKQCICTRPKEGGDKSASPVYPLQYNWTNRLSYVGRETLGIEYAWTTMTLDHWSFGPHHVWTVPASGSIIRMWQPYNGLQVFPNGTLTSPVDASKLTTIPPDECKSSSRFSFKIKCNASGYPEDTDASAAEMAAQSALTAHAAARSTAHAIRDAPGTASMDAAAAQEAPKAAMGATAKAAPDDPHMWRAVEKVPRKPYRGETFSHMSSVLNGWLRAKGPTKPCGEFNAEEVQKLQAMLYLLRFPAYDDVYLASNDNRRIRAELAQLQQDWTRLNEVAMAGDAKLAEMHRDGHCAEAVMWHVHHLQEDAKKLMAAQGVVLPTLSPMRHACPADATEAEREVCASYAEKVSCSDCHADVRP